MRRRILNSLAAFSLLLCIAILALWIRASFRRDIVFIERDSWILEASTAKDAAYLGWARFSIWQSPVQPVLEFHHGAVRPERGLHVWEIEEGLLAGRTNYIYGFAYSMHDSLEFKSFGLMIPFWFWVIATAMLPAARYWLWRRSPRNLAGSCASCGYDLRATPERCPECGAVRVDKANNATG